MNYVDKLYKILEEKGGRIADIAGKVLLEGVESPILREPLKYLAEHRHDVIRPTHMSCACEAVGGNPEDINDAAVAMVLKCYELGVLDDMVDTEDVIRFHYTLSGRFGREVALIVSVIINAKAFHALGLLAEKLDKVRFNLVNLAFRDFLVEMMEGEALNVEVKKQKIVAEKELIQIFNMQSADIEACMKIGAIISGGSRSEVKSLGEYGTILGTMFLIRDDVSDALNLTVKLVDLVRRGSFPYPLLWAINHSNEVKNFISTLQQKRMTPTKVEKLVTLLFKVGAVKHTKNLLMELSDDAIYLLNDIEKSEATEVLKLAAKVQPDLLLRKIYNQLGHCSASTEKTRFSILSM